MVPVMWKACPSTRTLRECSKGFLVVSKIHLALGNHKCKVRARNSAPNWRKFPKAFLLNRESCRLEKLAAMVPVMSRVCPSTYNLQECSSGVQVVGKIHLPWVTRSVTCVHEIQRVTGEKLPKAFCLEPRVV